MDIITKSISYLDLTPTPKVEKNTIRKGIEKTLAATALALPMQANAVLITPTLDNVNGILSLNLYNDSNSQYSGYNVEGPADALNQMVLGGEEPDFWSEAIFDNDPTAGVNVIEQYLSSGSFFNTNPSETDSVDLVFDMGVLNGLGYSTLQDFVNDGRYGPFTVDAHISTGGFDSNTYTLPHSAVPIPATAWLMGSGLLGLAAFGRRKETT